MARRGVTGRASEFAGRQPLDKYTNITNAATVRGLIRRGGPISGSASGVRSISSADAFNTLGQFFIGEALGVGLAAGAAKVLGLAAPKIGRAVSGARPMTTAERSAAVTRAGRTGVGKIGPSIKPQNPSPYMGDKRYFDAGDYFEPFNSYENAWYRGHAALNRKAAATKTPIRLPSQITDVSKTGNSARYKGFTNRFSVFDDWDESGYAHVRSTFKGIPEYMKKTLDWRATRAPLRRTASNKNRRVGK